MTNSQTLEKTNRINMLFDFYRHLLTEKQQTFLQYYFHEDYSLGEIAETFHISRQAVYEHIKRAGHVLDQYESKLGLLASHEQRERLLQELDTLVDQTQGEQKNHIKRLIQSLRDLELR